MGSEAVKTPDDSRSEAEKSETLPTIHGSAEELTSPPSHGTKAELTSPQSSKASDLCSTNIHKEQAVLKQGTSDEGILVLNTAVQKQGTSDEGIPVLNTAVQKQGTSDEGIPVLNTAVQKQGTSDEGIPVLNTAVQKQGTSDEGISGLNTVTTNHISTTEINNANDLNISNEPLTISIVNKQEPENRQLVALKQLSFENSIPSQSPPHIENETETSLRSNETINTFIENNSSTAFTLLLRKDSQQFCRICHEIGLDSAFISPCRCKGSLSLVHKWCLERWLAESDTNHCELCGFVFNVFRKPKFNMIWSLFVWLWSAAPRRERRLLLCDSLLFTALCPLIILTTVLAFQVADSIMGSEMNEKITQLGMQLSPDNTQLIASLITRLIQMTIVSFVITIDVGFVSWTALRSQYHIQRWYRWYRRNCKVVLRGYPEIRRTTLPTTESSSNIRSVSF